MIFPFVPPATLLAGALLFDSLTTNHYEFGNGSVAVDDPMTFRESGITLVEPSFLGAGGGGSVWKMTVAGGGTSSSSDKNHGNNVVVKISWARSTGSVRNECEVLRVMEQKKVTGVERCLGSKEYAYDPKRIVIAMEPFAEDNNNKSQTGDDDGSGDLTSRLDDLSPKMARKSAIQLSRTMAQMLAARVVTTDIQPLISKSKGDVLLIDMTEAKVLETVPLPAQGVKATSSSGLSDLDRALVNAFCTEILGLIPDELLDEASKSFWEEVRRIEAETPAGLDGDFKEILRDLPLAGAETFS